jgi:HEAT repeat protein
VEYQVREIVEQFSSGLGEDAFFALIELKGDVLPAIAAVFRSEPHPDIRALLINAAWERREDAVLPLLAEALNDEAEEVWQEALDGLVAFAGEHTLEILVQARSRKFTDGPSTQRFRLWLEEAIQQVQFELRAKT